ncbi:hypothetical protein AUP68_03164 [Ilyonectria robusta]
MQVGSALWGLHHSMITRRGGPPQQRPRGLLQIYAACSHIAGYSCPCRGKCTVRPNTVRKHRRCTMGSCPDLEMPASGWSSGRGPDGRGLTTRPLSQRPGSSLAKEESRKEKPLSKGKRVHRSRTHGSHHGGSASDWPAGE